MKAFDLKHIEYFKEIFPELTADQLETALLFSMGLSKKEIATIRSVSYMSIEKILEVIRKKFELHSFNHLFSVFQVRLFSSCLLRDSLKK